MKIEWMKRVSKWFMVATVLGVMGFGAGCDSGDDGGGGGGGFGGVWALNGGDTVQGSPVWFAHFNPDGTYFISDNADGSGVRVTGTYSVSGGNLVGPFTNPGVGEGRVEATIADGVIHLNFIEYWHTPNKVVPYAGVKM